MSFEAEIFTFLIELVKTILNYGPLGLAVLCLLLVFYLINNFDLTRRGKK